MKIHDLSFYLVNETTLAMLTGGVQEHNLVSSLFTAYGQAQHNSNTVKTSV
jgi:hypothetical protein